MKPDTLSLHQAISGAYLQDETECVHSLLAASQLDDSTLGNIAARAGKLIRQIRAAAQETSGIEAFMREYDLSSQEGISLMCLAEALLRIPDPDTAKQLINEKLTSANWQSHLGQSHSLFVNASTWSLMLTGKLIRLQSANIHRTLQELVSRSSEPVIRLAIKEAMRIIGQQFVMGETIEAALQRSRQKDHAAYRYSFDMLGEAALTQQDADAYFDNYLAAIQAIATAVTGPAALQDNPGISIKLSALHPRFEFTQRRRVIHELVPRVVHLIQQAQAAGIATTIDAEEANRLGLTLEVLQRLCQDNSIKQWEGLGIAVQAYQKRATAVIDWLAGLAAQHRQRLFLRLVKGAYWDTEIKQAQILGLADYPVFTRKASTDLSYLACVQKIFARRAAFYPQFATHNAYTIATILELAPAGYDYEFQRLHGMGQPLYRELLKTHPSIPCRVYAPVGSHKDLLPYLVRRLLENGANTSFVNRLENDDLPIEQLTRDPASLIREETSIPHPRIPKPRDLYAPHWLNSNGLNLDDPHTLQALNNRFKSYQNQTWQATPFINGRKTEAESRPILSAVDQQPLGTVVESTNGAIEAALDATHRFRDHWRRTPIESRARLLEAAANTLEVHMSELVYLCIREAGRCLKDAIAEVREAVDSCRYYAWCARQRLSALSLPGPTGEANTLHAHGRGVMVCISPWNFPVAIFTGQIAAALVAGNTVIAKPAQQTALTAMRLVELLHSAGIPPEALALLPGKSSVIGPPLLNDPRIAGVIFTGSTGAARHINQTLANRPGPILPLIAETGGQNAMLVDSSALPEQVVKDVLTSAFNSAGQRCSALRVLFLQDEIAPRIVELIRGALQELRIGDPMELSTDVGPLIDQLEAQKIAAHIATMQGAGKTVYQAQAAGELPWENYVSPTLIEIDDLSELKEEVFGPVLHIIRYPIEALDRVIESINHTRYGLTLGIHSRIDIRMEYIIQRVRVGNIYVNRDMIGAVVGVQPFGGENLSGTGPKVGGPNYLTRLINEQTVTVNTSAVGGNASLLNLEQ